MSHHPQADIDLSIPFDPRSGSLLERVFFNHRGLILLLCFFLTLVLGFQATRLHLGASFEKMIPTGHPYIANYLAHKTDLSGVGNVVRVVVETTEGTIYDADYLETLRKVSDELFLLPGVERPFMKSLWTPSTRWVGVTEDGLDGGPVMPDDYDGSTTAIEQVRANVSRSGEIGTLVAADMQSSIVLLPLMDVDTQTGQRLDYLQLSLRLDTLREKYGQGKIRIRVTGFAKVVGDLIAGLQQVLGFFGLAIAICTVVLYAYTRCARSTGLVVVCSLVAVVWLLGLLPLLGYELDPYSVLVPFLVFAIGMSHGAQKMNGIMQDIGRGAPRLVAARYTFRRLFMAGLTALLADAVGFSVLWIIDIGVIQDLALTASLGVAILVFTNLLLLPILLSYTGVSATAANRSLRAESTAEDVASPVKHPLWIFLDKFTQRRWATVALVVASVLGVFGFVTSLQLRIGDLEPGAPELRQDSTYNKDSAYVAAHYAASSDIFVAMVTTPQYQCANYDTLRKVDELEWKLQQLPGVESTQSLAGVVKRTAVGLNEGNLRWYELPRSQSMINAIVTRAPREVFNQNCDLLSVYIYLKDHKADTLQSVVDAVEGFAGVHNTDDVRFIQAAGNAGIEAATNMVVREANAKMLWLVYAAVSVLAYITFRSLRAVVCALVPLVLTSILCEALMVYLNIGIKVATLPVIALGVGIGVDYALYVLTVTLAQLRAGKTLSQAYFSALVFTGKVVVLTGLTLGVAVATWVFSPIKFQADMGVLLAFMFVWNMVGALILVPALGVFLLGPSRAIAGQSVGIVSKVAEL